MLDAFHVGRSSAGMEVHQTDVHDDDHAKCADACKDDASAHGEQSHGKEQLCAHLTKKKRAQKAAATTKP